MRPALGGWHEERQLRSSGRQRRQFRGTIAHIRYFSQPEH